MDEEVRLAGTGAEARGPRIDLTVGPAAAEARLWHQAIEGSLDPQVLLDPVRDGNGGIIDFRYAAANAAARARLGRPDLAGHTLRELYPEQAEDLFSGCVRVVETGEPMVADDFRMASPVAPGLRWLEIRAVRVGDLLSLSWRDVTDKHEANRRLLESEARYRLLAENTADVVAIGDLTGRIGWVSPSVHRLLGWDPDEFAGQDITALVHPDDKDRTANHLAQLRAGQTVSMRLRMLTSAGTYRWMDSRVSPVLDANGVPVGRVVGSRDVDDQVRSEQALAQSEARYRKVAESAGDFVAQTNPEGVIEWITPSVAAVIGWSPEELVGRVAADLADEPAREAAAQSVVRVQAGSVVSGRSRVICKDGSRRWLAYRIRPLIDADGQVTGRVSSWWDVQARVEAEHALAAEHAHTGALLDSLLDPHLTVTLAAPDPEAGEPAWVLSRINRAACRHFGLQGGQVLGRPVVEALPAPLGQLILGWCRDVRESGESLDTEDILVPAGTGDTWLDIHVVPVGDEVSIAAHDVTDRHAAAAELAAARDRYQLLAENASDVVAQTDSDGYVLWFAGSIEQYGWTGADIAGRRLSELVHPEDRPLLPELARDLRAGRPTSVELRIRERSGPGVHWFRGRLRPTYDASGEPSGWVSGWANIDAEMAARAALLDSEAHFRNAMTATASGIVVHGWDGAIIDCNPAAERILQVSRDELLGLDSLDPRWWAIREDGTPFPGQEHPVMVALATGLPVHDVVMGLAPPGAPTRWILINAELTVLRSQPGQRAVVVSFADITELRNARQAAGDSEARYRLLAENAADVVAIGGPDGQVQWVSPSLRAFTGWEPEQLVGRSFAEFIHPDDRPAAQQAQARVSAGEPVDYQARWRLADGQYRWFAYHVTPQFDDHTQVTGRVVGWRDIQAEVEAREAVGASEERYRLLAENASDVVYRMGVDGRLEWVSPSVRDLLGWHPEDLIGRRLSDRLHPADVDSGLSATQSVVHGETANHYEARFRTAAGTYKWLSMTARPIRDQDGRVVGRVGSARDITQAHETTEELRFLATHDPMTRLLNRVEAFDALGQLLARPRGATHTAVLYADLDHLKSINDTHGHAAGDAAIIETATRIQSAIRAGDTAARIGGDEFLILLPGIGNPGDAQQLVEKIRAATSQPMVWQDLRIPLTVSIGIHIAHPGQDPDDAIAMADAAAYEYKRRRKGQPPR